MLNGESHIYVLRNPCMTDVETTVNKSIHEAYIADQWAIFPTRDCLTRYIIALEDLHIELDGKKEITKEDVKETIRHIEKSGETDEEFVLLTRKGYKLPGISKPSIRLPLPVDPEIVWDFETDRFRHIVESWAENSDPVIKVRRHLRPDRLGDSNHTDDLRKQEISSKQLRGWIF